MTRSFYSYIRDRWKNLDDEKIKEVQNKRLQKWRDQGAIERIDRPTRIDKARSLGYKAKKGVVMARTRIKRGFRMERPDRGRRSKRTGINKRTRAKNLQQIAEERTERKFPNLEILNSYWVGEDGHHKWFEIILIDPDHPEIQSDDNLNWICEDTGRGFRAKTSAAKK